MSYTKGKWIYNSYDAIWCGDVNNGEKPELIAYVSHLGDKSKGDEIHGERADEAIANAKRIVTCVNSHDALVEALWQAIQLIHTVDVFGMLDNKSIETVRGLEQALQQAKEE